MSKFLTEKDKVILNIEKVVNYLREKIIGIEEIWIETNSLVFRVENKEHKDDYSGRYTIIPNFTNELIRNDIEFNILTTDGKHTPIYLIEKEIGKLFPELKEVENYKERLFLRESVNYKEELKKAKQNLLAQNLDSEMNYTKSTTKKNKI